MVGATHILLDKAAVEDTYGGGGGGRRRTSRERAMAAQMSQDQLMNQYAAMANSNAVFNPAMLANVASAQRDRTDNEEMRREYMQVIEQARRATYGAPAPSEPPPEKPKKAKENEFTI